MKAVAATVFAVGAAFSAPAVTLTPGEQTARTLFPRAISGIAYVGGDEYYAVADNGPECGLYPCRLRLGADGRSVASFSVDTNGFVRLKGAVDLEAVAYDPLSRNVWAADEAGRSIKEYDPKTGAVVQSLDLPKVFAKTRLNYGLESLAISRNGLTLWTANEEALPLDGDKSSHDGGTTVRLAKFVRKSARDRFRLAAMYPYTTGRWHNRYKGGGAARRGVVELCALPGGALLVLERECSFAREGTDIWAKLSGGFWCTVCLVAEPDGVRDVKDVQSLCAERCQSVEKTVLFDFTAGLNNYEGMCLGPRLSDKALSVILVTDAGDGRTAPSILPLVLDLSAKRSE